MPIDICLSFKAYLAFTKGHPRRLIIMYKYANSEPVDGVYYYQFKEVW